MFGRRILLSVGFITIHLALFLVACNAKKDEPCHPSSCGNIHYISFPFYLKGDPRNCGDRSYNYELACEDNRTILYLFSGRFYVEDIGYANSTIRLVDPGVHKGNCSSLPLYSLTNYNFSSPAISFKLRATNPYYFYGLYNTIIFSNCEYPVNAHQYVDTSTCISGSSSTSSSLQRYSYAIVGPMRVLDFEDSCSFDVMVWSRLTPFGNYSLSDIHDELVWGFELRWPKGYCVECEQKWYNNIAESSIVHFAYSHAYKIIPRYYCA
ncbi:hypothetical protein HHK36_027529 [Tetracentron sinense]|uniref:Wall-associated receptor kinase galacturonan-binding domain-containing protein n=1 Tax=Tetracentron sinense TaxID=13715 RepID=A0A834YF07_TETSI|nr:hypothetical protein HHK36_027529 [Tetracentron sinense]